MIGFTFGQQVDTIRIQNHQLFVVDSLIAKYVALETTDEKLSSYSLKHMAVVFEREQFLRKYGLATETTMLRHYPTTEWQLIPYYRRNDGKLEEVVSFDFKLIEKARLREKHKNIGAASLVFVGLIGVSYRFTTRHESKDMGQAIGQEIGRVIIPIAGAVSMLGGFVLLAR